jgi:hypothetical protein
MVVEDRRRAGVRVQAGGIDAGAEDVMQAGLVIKARSATQPAAAQHVA